MFILLTKSYFAEMKPVGEWRKQVTCGDSGHLLGHLPLLTLLLMASLATSSSSADRNSTTVANCQLLPKPHQ